MKTRLFILFSFLAPLVWGQDPLVMTSQGLVRGVQAEDGDYTMFLGVRYAVVDPANLFGVSLSPPLFEGIFEANDDTLVCPQADEFTNIVGGDLDCLRLNIYVPQSASSENRLPVMMWLHGGRFEFGSGGQYLFGPQYIVRHEVILVTVNYRLGPYGFMCLDIPSVPGNSGLKDQRAALRWINENIEAFGGDPDSVTLAGQSAGGISTEFHILSPGSSGLFHRAITQSGSVLTEKTLKNDTKLAPLDIANYFGFTTDDLDTALQFMGTLEADALIAAVIDLGMRFEPCVEMSFEGVDNFLPTSPLISFASGGYNRVPMLMGYNNDEVGFHLIYMRGVDDYMDQHMNIFRDTLQSYFYFPDEDELDKVAKIIKEFSIGTKEVNEDLRGFINFHSNTKIHPVERSLLYHQANSDNPIYKYLFAYNGGRNFMKQMYDYDSTEGGAFHTDEIGYLFKQSFMPLDMSPEDQLITDRMTTLWTNFVKFGNPTPSVTELLPFVLPPVSTPQRECLVIDSDFRVDDRPFHKRMAFWDLYYLAYGEYEIGR